MIEVEKINNVLSVVVFNNSLVIFTNDNLVSGEYVKSIFHCKIYENFLIYQEDIFSDIVLMLKDGKHIKIEGEFNLSGATNTKKEIIIANRKTRTYNSLNKEKFSLNDRKIYFKANHSISCYRYDVLGSRLSFYIALDGTKLWDIDVKGIGKAIVWSSKQKEEVEEENSISGDLLNYNDEIAIIPLKGGQLLAVEMKSGKEIWMLEEPKSGRQVIHKDKIYAQSYPNIIEISATEGRVLRSIDLSSMRRDYNFDLTGQLEVFEDYLFVFSPDGKIAMIDKENFSLSDFLEFEGTIPNNHGHLVWHENKLYVHTWGDTLLVFEKE